MGRFDVHRARELGVIDAAELAEAEAAARTQEGGH